MQLQFSLEAAETLDRLESDPANDRLVDSIWEALEIIENSPGSAQARRRELRTPQGHSVWLVPVPNRHSENPWVILWQPRNGDALIAYVGPEDFGAK